MLTKSKTVSVNEIAKSLKMSAKVARRKLRDNYPSKPKAGWVFQPSQRAAVVRLLKS
jgi:hypothetical protein